MLLLLTSVEFDTGLGIFCPIAGSILPLKLFVCSMAFKQIKFEMQTNYFQINLQHQRKIASQSKSQKSKLSHSNLKPGTKSWTTSSGNKLFKKKQLKHIPFIRETYCQCLDISENYIRKIENLNPLNNLRHINLNCNKLLRFDQLCKHSLLQTIEVCYNMIVEIPRQLHLLKFLQILKISHNKIEGGETLANFKGIKLKELDMRVNPVCKSQDYCKKVLRLLKHLVNFDGVQLKFREDKTIENTPIQGKYDNSILCFKNVFINGFDSTIRRSRKKLLDPFNLKSIENITKMEENTQEEINNADIRNFQVRLKDLMNQNNQLYLDIMRMDSKGQKEIQVRLRDFNGMISQCLNACQRYRSEMKIENNQDAESSLFLRKGLHLLQTQSVELQKLFPANCQFKSVFEGLSHVFQEYYQLIGEILRTGNCKCLQEDERVKLLLEENSKLKKQKDEQKEIYQNKLEQWGLLYRKFEEEMKDNKLKMEELVYKEREQHLRNKEAMEKVIETQEQIMTMLKQKLTGEHIQYILKRQAQTIEELLIFLDEKEKERELLLNKNIELSAKLVNELEEQTSKALQKKNLIRNNCFTSVDEEKEQVKKGKIGFCSFSFKKSEDDKLRINSSINLSRSKQFCYKSIKLNQTEGYRELMRYKLRNSIEEILRRSNSLKERNRKERKIRFLSHKI